MSNAKETVLKVDGMTCSSCINHVEGALRELGGIEHVEANLTAGQVKVTHDPARTPVAAMIAALDEAGYGSRPAGTAPATIEREELAAVLATRRAPLVFEVLDAPYYEAGHLPGARLMPPARILESARAHAKGPDDDIVLYCASLTCGNSEVAARALRAAGYRKIRVYRGGKADWLDAGLPVERGPARSSLAG